MPGLEEVFRRAFGHERNIETIGWARRADVRQPGRTRAFEAVAHAQRSGLLVFGLGEGLLQILNEPGFTPKSF